MRVLIALAACAGCYRPHFENCEYSCASQPCPSGLTCNAAQQCVNAPGASCGGDSDVPTTCPGWTFGISNVAGCLSPPTGNWMVSTNIDIIATATNPSAPGAPHVDVIAGYLVIRAVDVVIPSGITVRITGIVGTTTMLPVIIAASNSVTIDGTLKGELPTSTLNAEPNPSDPCFVGLGGDATTCTTGTAGGGGGGFGQIGGDGASCAGGLGGIGGRANGLADLVPLRAGCPGGRGAGTAASGAGGPGGYAGGAIQISTANLIIAGTIDMNGGPGSTDTSTIFDGGGGGGSGGAILLEAVLGMLRTGARLCANGGGGAGEQSPATRPMVCDAVPAGPIDSDGFTRGGAGGYATTPARPGISQNSYGGGAGGSVGRIHLSTAISRAAGAIITPPAN